MKPSTLFITGATGLVGSHLTTACQGRGIPIRALVRSGSDTMHLKQAGADLCFGDLRDASLPANALDEIESVVHCAAKVGDWGDIADYREVNVEGLRKLLDACIGKSLKRIVILSTLNVYAPGDHYGTDETTPLQSHPLNGYTQSKVEAEQLALEYRKRHQLPLVILRPGTIFGPGDRMIFMPLVEKLRLGQVMHVDGGRRALNTIYVKNLIAAIFQAIQNPRAVGETYNITDGEVVSKRRYVEAIADGMGVKRPWISIPMFLARRLTSLVENHARKRRWSSSPRFTQARLRFFGYNLDFSIAKARTHLGYHPPYTFEAAMQETIAWFQAHSASSDQEQSKWNSPANGSPS